MDRIHFIEQQVERLDDQAFAAFLAWFDRYADLRWAGQWTAGRDVDNSVACISEGAGRFRIDDLRIDRHRAEYGGAAHQAADQRTARMLCEPQASAWLAQTLRRD